MAENNFRRDDSNLVYRKAVVVTQEDGAIVDLYYKEDRFENYYVKRIED